MLWQPDSVRARQSLLWRFSEDTRHLHGCTPDNYAGLHAWSISDRAAFWSSVWDACGVIGDRGEVALAAGGDMQADRYFPQAQLNFAENLLRREGDDPAIIFHREDGQRREWSWDELRSTVSRLQQALAELGVGPGDRVAAILPNVPEAIALMLAVTSLGAVWCSCSPDFGAAAIVDRIGQIRPKLLIAVDGYLYAGKSFDISATVRAVVGTLGVSATLIVDLLGGADALGTTIEGGRSFGALVTSYEPAELQFPRFPFQHPLFILFSSGTTGKPKCIVHSAGGTLLQHLKEHRLHCDIRPGSRLFYFTTLGWMMWNWQASALASGATLCLYDGSPGHPAAQRLFELVAAERVTHFGTSAAYLERLRKLAADPGHELDLGALRMILSTGSPLSADAFEYVYRSVKEDVHLASISGGTDIVSCFVLGVPTLPVYAGEIQGPGLGMAVDVYNETGRPLRAGKGELVCTRSFPSMPVGFWDDPDGSRYRAAYFGRFPGVWTHGDYAEWTTHGGVVIHGRSDATLNPGGVRIGTAEIYAAIEGLREIEGALCIGQDWQDDTRVVLFLKLREGAVLDDALRDLVKATIRSRTSPRHVPARIVAVSDLPRTRSGKLAELAVRDIVHGQPVRNADSLANPESLTQFVSIRELQQ